MRLRAVPLKCTFCPERAIRVIVVKPRTLGAAVEELPIRNCGKLSCIADADYNAGFYDPVRVEKGRQIRT